MSLIDLSVSNFINEVDSTSPAPGGGSVSALVSTLGVSLTKMVVHLTIGKKKFLSLDENIQNEYLSNFAVLNTFKEKLTELIDKDTIAFNNIMTAMKLPKEDPTRNEKIEQATFEAINVPLEVTRQSLMALEVLPKMIEYGNKNALSDIGVGALLLYAGIEGAILNIKINLSGLTDVEVISMNNYYCDETLRKADKLKNDILQYVYRNL